METTNKIYFTRITSEKTYVNPKGYPFKKEIAGFKCNFCDYFHARIKAMEKHLKEKHPEKITPQDSIKDLKEEVPPAKPVKAKLTFKKIQRTKKQDLFSEEPAQSPNLATISPNSEESGDWTEFLED